MSGFRGLLRAEHPNLLFSASRNGERADYKFLCSPLARTREKGLGRSALNNPQTL